MSIPFHKCPVKSIITPARTQTMEQPTTGTIDKIIITTPQIRASSIPVIQKINPPSLP